MNGIYFSPICILYIVDLSKVSYRYILYNKTLIMQIVTAALSMRILPDTYIIAKRMTFKPHRLHIRLFAIGFCPRIHLQKYEMKKSIGEILI
jgi:hypothetical protein